MLNILIINIPMGCASNSTETKNSEKENKQFGKNQKEIETSPEEKKENKQQVENIIKEEKYIKPFIPGAYLYTVEEQDFIQKMYEESQRKEDNNQLLFYKQVIKRNKKITNHKEIFTLKKRKTTSICNDHFYFKSPSIKARDANVISRKYFTKNEKFSMTSDLIIKQYIWHDFVIFFSDSNEDQLITFEIITEYQTPVHKMLTFIPFDLKNDKDKKIEYDITNCKKIKIYIEYAACFSFLGMNNDILYLKNLKRMGWSMCAY